MIPFSATFANESSFVIVPDRNARRGDWEGKEVR